MTLYFAYGSNMSRLLMGRHCPRARPLGTAVLAHHRFIVMSDGYASVTPAARASVHGVLWRLAPGEVGALDDYEGVAAGLYRSCRLPVQHGARSLSALVYIGRSHIHGQPKPGYLGLVL